MVDWELYGDRAGGHHLTSLLLHALNAALLLLVLQRLTGSLWRSALVAALFAWHPLHVESVAWVSERKDVLSGLFWLLTIWAYARYVERRSKQRYAVTLGFFALGLMSKPMVVTLPCVLLLLDWWPLRRWAGPGAPAGGARARRAGKTEPLKSLLLEKVPFAVLAIGSAAATLWAQRAGGAVTAVNLVPLGNRVANALISYQRYLEMTFLPRHLAVIYPHPQDTWTWWRLSIAILLLAAVSVLAVRRARRGGSLLVGWLWYLGTLVPVIGIVQVGSQALADRYTYLPLIGVFVIIVWGLAEVPGTRHLPKSGLAAAACLALVACLALTARQLRVWEDSVTLFENAAAVVPRNFIAHRNLGKVLVELGSYQEGIAHYKKALEYLPQYTEVYNDWGVALLKQNKHAEALPLFVKALDIKPANIEARVNLANSLALLGKPEEAAGHYREIIKIKPGFADAHCYLGNAYFRSGRYDDAVAAYTRALELRADYAEAHIGLGLAFSKKGRVDESIAQYRESLRLNANLMEANHNLALALAEKGAMDEALVYYAEAVRLQPLNAEVRLNYANAFVKNNQLNDALAQFEEFLRLQPANAEARASYAFTLAKLQRLPEAAAEYAESLRLNPNQMEARNNYGWVLSTLGRKDEAVEQYRQATRVKPEAPETHFNLGQLLYRQGQYPGALEEFREVIRLNPRHAAAHTEAGNCLLKQAKFSEAAASYRTAARLAPGDPVPHNQLGLALVALRNVPEAIAEFREALRLKPEWIAPLNALAWILATHEDAAIRNGSEAVALATRAVQAATAATKPQLLGTLAAARAENGQFDQAVAAVKTALELARAAGQAETVAQLEKGLPLYLARQPFRDTLFSKPKPRMTVTPIEVEKK